jgi:hypothetical protein
LLCPGAPDDELPDELPGDGDVAAGGAVAVLPEASDLAAGAGAGAAVGAGAGAGAADEDEPLFWPGADDGEEPELPEDELPEDEPEPALPRPAVGLLVPVVVFADLL